MSAIQEAAGTKGLKRNTGDWRGLPTVLAWISAVGFAGSLFAGFAVFVDASSFRGSSAVGADWLIAASIFGAALLTYCVAAMIAALRGILDAKRG